MYKNIVRKENYFLTLILFVFIQITSYGFNNMNISITDSCVDTVSFTKNYTSQNIYLLDSYSSKNSIKLYWSTGFGIDPPYLYFKEVVVYFSLTSPDSGFCELLRRNNAGIDSTLIEELDEGDTYYFRVATFDSTGQMNSVSNPIMTILGEPVSVNLSFSAPQRENPSYYKGIAWSFDNNSLAFLKKIDNSVNILSVNLSTLSISQITNYSGTDYRLIGLDWSPDNKWISYSYSSSSTANELDYRIWLISPDGGTLHSVTSGRVDGSATWVSSTSILFTKGTTGPPNIPEFYTIDLNNDNYEKPLTSDQLIRKYNPSVDFVHDLVAFYGSTDDQSGIYTMSLLGENIEPIIENDYWSDIHPFWTGDGQNIIFTSSRSGHYEIWSINIESKRIQQITHSQIREVKRFYGRPSPDGSQLAVLELDNILDNAKIKLIPNEIISDINLHQNYSSFTFILHQNYPNPFNPLTTIRYSVPKLSHVSIKVYDVLGRKVATLVNEEKPIGNYEIQFNAKNIASGVYFYRMQAGSFVETKKIILLK